MGRVRRVQVALGTGEPFIVRSKGEMRDLEFGQCELRRASGP